MQRSDVATSCGGEIEIEATIIGNIEGSRRNLPGQRLRIPHHDPQEGKEDAHLIEFMGTWWPSLDKSTVQLSTDGVWSLD